MKRTFVVAITVATLLIGGVALAIVATPDETEPEAAKETRGTTTTLVEHEEEVELGLPDGEDVKPEEDLEKPGDHVEEPEEEKEPEPDTTPPDLAILYPENGAHFTESTLAFEGIVEPGSKVYAAGYEADVDEEGHWRIVLILSPGGNLAKFTAVDAAGNESHADVQVFLDVEKEPEEEPKETEFVAHQKYGSCAETPPYDVFYGSGTPGTEVWVGSEFGTGNTVVGENGKWELKVYFEGAPCNDAFAVVIESNDGYRKVFEFMRTCEPEEGGDK